MEKKDLLLKDYGEAWQHYRHLEENRGKYMNFFFTALFALFGFYTALMKVESIDFIIWILLLYLFSIFTLYIYVNIVRLGWVLKGYGKILREIKKLFYDDELYQLLSVNSHLPNFEKLKNGGISENIFSLQLSSKFLLLTTLAIINLIIISCICINYHNIGFLKLLLLCISFLFLLTLESYSVIITYRIDKQIRKRK